MTQDGHEPKEIKTANDLNAGDPRNDQFFPSRVICVAMDDSAVSRHALAWTLKHLVVQETEQVTILHVTECVTKSLFLSGIYEFKLAGQVEEKKREMAGKTADFFHALKELLVETQTHFMFVPLEGDPGHEIVKYLDQVVPRIVVVGAENKMALKRMVLGSVSTFVAQNSMSVPVVIVHKDCPL